ncbi:MAG TPA: TIGR03943 family protein [Chloroflexota bacterium]|nr:TIGR03943 family protein [Chloroflexota bacterium]
MRLKTIAKVILFLSLGLFLASRLSNGTLSFYIHPRFNPLTAVTAITFFLVGLIYAYQHRHTILHSATEHDHDHHDHTHDHDHSHDLSWLALAILAIPVLLGVMVQPKPLGAAALGNREINTGLLTSAQAPSGSQLAVIPTAGERNILDWLYLFRDRGNAAAFNGESVHVIGFVYRDDRFTADEFMVSRFTVSCCVADAAPIGLIVRWPDAPELAPDQWVEVKGTFQAGTFNGNEMPLLIADEVVNTDPPSQPYLYQ